MYKTTKLASTIVIGLILVAITVAIFFLGTTSPRVQLDFTALTFILISELLLIGYFLWLAMAKSPSGARIIRVGIISTLGIYSAVSLLMALFRGAFAEKPNNFTIVNLILIGVAGVVCTLLNAFATRVQAVDEKSSEINTQGKRGGF